MFTEDVRSNLQNIIQGIVIQEQSNSCTTIRNHLCASYPTSTTVKKDFESKQLIKEEQVRFLKALADSENLLIKEIPGNWIYLTEGGESKVYLHPDQLSVIKLNDAAYYATWLEYFNSLVIHNKEFGLILEDMHDENVILKDGSLFFIDTVFYIMK